LARTGPETGQLRRRMAFREACRVWLLALGIALGGGCASPSLEQQALDRGLQAETVLGTDFHHRIFRTGNPNGDRSAPLILLIDGDGRAFLDRQHVAADPTPDRSWLLDLAPTLAPLGPVVYLGRPCYYGTNTDEACTPRLWTLDRYGDAVVASLSKATAALLAPGQRALIVGYSGGGVLAVLVGQRLGERTLGVITFAAPLDVTAWADLHGYSRLDGSIDPANDPARYTSLCQRHLFGSRDREVPPELVSGWRWPDDRVTAGLATDHTCCWKPIAREAIAAQLGACGQPVAE